MEGVKQKTFVLNNNVVISSKFQSGNLCQAIQKAQNHYNLWIGADHNSTYKTWFYFSIQGVEVNSIITFTINNMNNQLKLFKEGHLPVFREQQNQNWQRIKIAIQQNGIAKAQDGYQLTFKHHFSNKCKTYFAFSYPFTTLDSDKFINDLISTKQETIFASYQNLAVTPCKRTVKMLTVTKLGKGSQWEQIQMSQDQCSMKPMKFEGKKGVFVSARVHPGQVASSHILNGVLIQLFKGTQDSQQLLNNFVFYIVPIINPDGVDEGNFRTNCTGKNLNRYYKNPNKSQEPEIHTIKQFLIRMIRSKSIEFCLDLHAHANKQGTFIYGNSVQDLKGQVEVCLFPKILAYNTPYFDYDACNFSQNNMTSRDKADDLSKQGASRVAIFKQTGLKACWTLQCNYNSCRYVNQMKNCQVQSLKSVSNGVLSQKITPQTKQQKTILGIKQFHQIGQAICQSILDYYALRPTARYYSGKVKSRQNFIINLGIQALRMIPFRFDNNCRKLLMAINNNMNISQNIDKVRQILSGFQVGKTKLLLKQMKKEQQTKFKQVQKSSLRSMKTQGQISTKGGVGTQRTDSMNNKQKMKSMGNGRYSLSKRQIKLPQYKPIVKPVKIGKLQIPYPLNKTQGKSKTNQDQTKKIPPRPSIQIKRKL